MSCADNEPEVADVISVGGSTMGTAWSLSWVEDERFPTVPVEQVQQAIETELARLNALMSTWNPESELSGFNQSFSLEPVSLHADTLTVIDNALVISRLTDGRYDITLQPVIDLWGFNRDTSTPTPNADEIKAALEKSGHARLVRVGDTIRKRDAQVSLDVSSLAKGFAVDKLGEVAESLGLVNYIVDIGGELRARGVRADGEPWRVGIENPEGEVEQVVSLLDTHIATSGSYRNYRIENGERLSHIIDGSTGSPIRHDLVSVSVVHESTMLADAWATALLIVGEPAAQKLIQEQGLTAQLTVFRQGRFKQFASDAFSKLGVVAEP